LKNLIELAPAFRRCRVAGVLQLRVRRRRRRESECHHRRHGQLENLRALLSRPDHLFWASLTNSVMVTVLSILVLTVLSAMLGHYLARSRSRWTRALMLLLLCGLMIPPQVILMPVTQVLRMAHLLTTVQGLVLFNVGYYIPFGVFVFSGFLRSIPVELEEAASIDGASRGQVFWRIVFPLLRPATASVLIFLGVWIWNDFLDPLIILGPSQGIPSPPASTARSASTRPTSAPSSR
jgi:raffinose/stachyose/melibiose transport system permease protein